MIFRFVKLIFILCLLNNGLLAQQAGDLDSTFGINGKVITSINGIDDRIFALKVQPDNKIVVAGAVTTGSQRDFVIARYENNGQLDTTFGSGGYTITSVGDSSDVIREIQLQANGKIVAVGEAYIDTGYTVALARYNNNGSIDSTFGQNGILVKSIAPGQNSSNSILISLSNKIYVAASTYSNFVILKLDENGNIDSSFGNSGISILPASIGNIQTMAFLNDSTIICGGGSLTPDFSLFSLDTTGNFNAGFGINGLVITDLGYYAEGIEDLELITNGKIVVGGWVANAFQNWDYVIAKYNSNGDLDSTFGVNGRLITSFTNGRDILQKISVQTDGKIVATGYCGNVDFGIIRCNTNGTLDNTFGVNGKVVTDYNFDWDLAFAMDIQPDYKIIAAGETHIGSVWNFALARYLSGLNVGILEFKNEQSPLLIYPNPVLQYANITYTLNQNQKITMSLHDLNGRTIKTFMQAETKTEGEHTEYLYFDEIIKAGVYILNIDNGKTIRSIKIVKD